MSKKLEEFEKDFEEKKEELLKLQQRKNELEQALEQINNRSQQIAGAMDYISKEYNKLIKIHRERASPTKGDLETISNGNDNKNT